MTTPWRLIIESQPLDGATNMARDEAILRSVAAGDALPTLRFYQWAPACLSLGRGQKASDVDFERVNAQGWHVVRRPSGGRAILHTDELTYSICAPETHPVMDGGITLSYRRISAGLMLALDRLGADVQNDSVADGQKLRNAPPVCFEVPSNYEITFADKKLIGSAQLRRKGVVLQHGTLPLHDDIARICDALAYHTEAARETAKAQVVARACTLETALGQVMAFSDVAKVLAEALAETLEMQLTSATYSDAELAEATSQFETVYATDAHTHRL